ncbi:helix-turn-helix transcriptional regulator [Vibrio gallicus]|uniref:helix-turn-helix transcriptional regulator n=1 Tax=Vibrio gallicus TaxID=190897 RepID=UPI0021C29A0A|nr:helix-turn-helix domain-containing protein [Vibrio gallicus]
MSISNKEFIVQNKLLSTTEVCELIGRGRNTLWRWTKAGLFAKPVLHPEYGTVIGYQASDVQEWIQSSKQA